MNSIRAVALSTTLTALSLTAVQAADDYQWEVGGRFELTMTDNDNSLWDGVLGPFVEYHFAPVKQDGHPFEEAAFLEHSTFVRAQIGLRNISDDDIAASGPALAVGFTYATPDFPVRLSADFATSSAEDEDFGVDVTTTSFNLEAGYWIKPELIAGLRLGNTDTDNGGDSTVFDIGAFGKWVIDLNDTIALNAEADLGQSSYDAGGSKDSNIVVGVAGDVYFSQQYGIGLLIGSESGDVAAAEGSTVGFRASAWFTEHFGIKFGYETFSPSDDTVDGSDSLLIEIAGRF